MAGRQARQTTADRTKLHFRCLHACTANGPLHQPSRNVAASQRRLVPPAAWTARAASSAAARAAGQLSPCPAHERCRPSRGMSRHALRDGQFASFHAVSPARPMLKGHRSCPGVRPCMCQCVCLGLLGMHSTPGRACEHGSAVAGRAVRHIAPRPELGECWRATALRGR